MEKAYISIGSNLGERERNCRRAVEGISAFAGVTAVSSYYETEPVGVEDQPLFINCAIEIATDLAPRELLRKLQAIENKLGRTHKIKWGPRTIDLDIIFYGNEIINDSDLKVPHPEAHKRRFVLEPIREIAPELVHPLLKLSVTELLDSLNDPHKVVKLDASSTPDPQ